ncbi:hypothetical protein DVH05_020819 [Phytophthora capsici]|nr:hypothetical protein DVH05_020819 [Phytophthora capsici]
MNGEDAGDMVEEYQQAYMTKEKGGLKYAAVAMHTAAGDILKFPSVADDSGTDLRTAKHLAARTVNAFSGGTEWSHSLMAYALAGHRSYLSSDSFWYVFPNKLVDYVINEALAGAGPDDDEQIGAEVEEKVVHETLDDLIVFANEEETSSAGGAMNTGARMYRISNGEMVLVTQVVSYRCRGKWFEAYSPLEFEMIVDILPRTDDSERDLSRRGRPKRRGFDLSPEHPLAPHFQGFIRAKFKTPMLGGAPPPAVLQNGQPSAALRVEFYWSKLFESPALPVPPQHTAKAVAL